ncbi:MAG: DUF6465 family protein [Lachnospiraceae bacterium]|jgi:hypothetical protein|nr:DUF6465 family protein [Lachnospiraceae bacterium]
MKTVKAIAKETAKVTAPEVETVPEKKTASKTEVKADKKETVKKETKAEAEKAAPTAAEAPKKAEEPKAAVAKTKTAPEKKTPAKKAPAKKAAIKETVFLQYGGKEISNEDVVKKVKEIWTKTLKNKVGDIKTISIYLKPEENMAYYVINDDVTGSVEL